MIPTGQCFVQMLRSGEKLERVAIGYSNSKSATNEDDSLFLSETPSHYVAMVGLELTLQTWLAPVSQLLGLKVCVTMPASTQSSFLRF